MSAELSTFDLQAREARRAVATALRTGKLERQPCAECGAPAEAHHHNGYEPEHWLDVIWLCRAHHSQRHFLGHQQWVAVKAAKGAPLSIREIRELRGVTQVAIAERMGLSQSNISAIEARPNNALSTIRAYVEALGGTLEIAAVFEDGRTLIALG